MFKFKSSVIEDLQKTLLWSVGITFLIVLICWLFFDFRIARRTRGWLGMSMGRITIIDDSGVAGAERKLLPLMKKYDFNLCVGVHPRCTSQKDAEKIKKYGFQPVYTPLCYSSEQLKLRGSRGLDLEFEEDKKALAKMGIATKDMLYPWSGVCEQAMREHAKKHFRYAFKRVNTSSTSNREIKDSSYVRATIIVDSKKDIDKDKLLTFAEYVSGTYGWGILIIRSGYGAFGQKSIAALDEMLQFCKDNNVEIGVVEI